MPSTSDADWCYVDWTLHEDDDGDGSCDVDNGAGRASLNNRFPASMESFFFLKNETRIVGTHSEWITNRLTFINSERKWLNISGAGNFRSGTNRCCDSSSTSGTEKMRSYSTPITYGPADAKLGANGSRTASNTRMRGTDAGRRLRTARRVFHYAALSGPVAHHRRSDAAPGVTRYDRNRILV